MKRKGAIELSANFIIVIIISLVIVVGGLSLFFKMKNSAQTYADTLDRQTEENIKQMMLSNNYRVAVYPTDSKISNGDAVLVGVGITNIYTDSAPKTFDVTLTSVDYYVSSDATKDPKGNGKEYSDMSSPSITIPSGGQAVKGVLIKMPKDVPKGQYIYTIKVTASGDSYGVVQVYVTN